MCRRCRRCGKGSAPFRPLYRLVFRIGEFFEAVRAAKAVGKRAERYYAMNSAQLAEIGLTREQIPAVLLREFDRAHLARRPVAGQTTSV